MRTIPKYGSKAKRAYLEYPDGRTGELKKKVDKLYNLIIDHKVKPEHVITEDSNAGYQCFEKIYPDICEPAGGKSKVYDICTRIIRISDLNNNVGKEKVWYQKR